MPHSIKVYKCLRAAGFEEKRALACAAVMEQAKTTDSVFDQEAIANTLFDAGFTDVQAETLADVFRNCFPSQRFATWFDKTRLKTALVRAKIPADIAESLLTTIDASIVTPRTPEARVQVNFAPAPGHVVMCDFSHLRKPEMQKERRVIVVGRSHHSPGRCIVVPVSMTPAKSPHPHHYQFAPGSYPFFHRTDPVWATCDHIYTVALDRLWLINIGRKPVRGASISTADLMAIRKLLGTALNI